MLQLLLIILLLFSLSASSQKKWDGGGGNNLWSNALNWTGNTIPSVTDNVLLDNSVITGNYTVSLPATAVTVKTIAITPTAGRTIELTLPSSNTAVPGLTCSGPAYGLTVNSGGTFRNSSGSTFGNTVNILDSIKINNEGRYVHNSQSSHATNVQFLSRSPGTERGILELDIPAASSTISMSGRTFGRLTLRATAAGGSCNYTAAGTSKVFIRNSLDIGAGVNLNLNFSDTIIVAADLLQEVGTLNLGNSTRSVVLAVQQNITQNTGGVITETGTGIQTILLNGGGLQQMVCRGVISNQVGLTKDGAGITLCKAAVSLPYKLKLKNGRIITHSLITLQASCTIEVDTLSDNSFIDGPLKKDGLNNQSFLFPVGKSGILRWVQLQNATGNFTVEYFKSDPHLLSANSGAGLHHFSSVEYWDITASTGAAAKVKVSFDDPNSGGVTNLSSLRVARLINGTWENAGNAGVSGTPGSDGWVSSNAASGFSAVTKSFALASAMGQENPLPISSVMLDAKRYNNEILFKWKVDADMRIRKFALQRSFDGRNFNNVFSMSALDGISDYSHKLRAEKTSVYYKLIAWNENPGKEYFSESVFISSKYQNYLCVAGSNMVSQHLKLLLPSRARAEYILVVYHASGVVAAVQKYHVDRVNSFVLLNVSGLRPGMYFIKDLNGVDAETIKFIKI